MFINGGVVMKLTILLTLLILFSLFIVGCSNRGGEDMKNPIVVIETSKGIMEVELDAKNAPITTANFLNYTKEGYYDGLIFHRVMPGFMIQGGGFYSNGTQKATRAPIKLESRNGLKNMKGTIAMARTTVPDSATSQFFINTVDNEFLNYKPGNDGYAVFGKVVVGLDVMAQIEKVKTGNFSRNQDWPVETVTIKRIYLKE
jgi:cyclophilin family peptidyl-prolyl cis-trans isomerase